MKKILLILLLIPSIIFGQDKEPSKFKKDLKKTFKFSTFYGAINGGTSLSDRNVYSVLNGLETTTIETPFDYSMVLGVRKIARFDYENRANVFYDGTEGNLGDNATVGKIKGLEFLFEGDYRRIQGINYLNQHHFLRYVADKWVAKVEYLKDGFVDVEYFEASQRYRYNVNENFSFNLGVAQRLSEPYGYDPLAEWLLSNGNLHYTYLALQEGYNVEFDGFGGEIYYSPNGTVVANSTAVWEEVVIPQVLADYVERKKDEAPLKFEYSLVAGFDFYHYEKNFWTHAWGNVMPYHLKSDDEFSFHNYNGGQWVDYSGGLIFGYKLTRSFGIFAEGQYHKYWNRRWHEFSMGVNYIIF